jgi:CBS domain-containing protein
MRVIKIAQVPAPSVGADASVLDAVRTMQESQGGACAVMDGAELVGIFSERDLMLRVVGAGLDPQKTSVGQVMTEDLETVNSETDSSDALSLMVSKHIRHLPVVDEDGDLAGLLSIRNLLQFHVEELVDQLNSLEAYHAADGPGG